MLTRETTERAVAEQASVEIVVPVYNEQTALERSIRRLHEFLSEGLPFAWSIVIADDASIDATHAIATALAEELPHVRVVRLAQKGRGRARAHGVVAERGRHSSPTWTSTSRPI